MARNLWPADLHLIGKEIVRFHAIFWPAFLMAAEVPLPKRIFAHGWLLFENDKMSKSRGNIVRAEPIRQVMGADALRYFLLREIVFGQDGSFSYDALVNRYNSDLANGLGNLASRTLTMISQYRGGAIPEGSDPEIAALAGQTIRTVQETFDRFEFSKGLEAVWAPDRRGGQIHRAEGAVEAGASSPIRRTRRGSRPRSTRPPRRCASPPRCFAGDAAIGAEDLGAARHAGSARIRALRRPLLGPASHRPEDRRNRRRVPAHRS